MHFYEDASLSMSVIMALWVAINGSFIFITTKKHHTLSIDPRLLAYSSGVFAVVVAFYAVSFGWAVFGERIIVPPITLFVAWLGIVFGAALMIVSRRYLRDLTASEIFFARNPVRVRLGPYRHLEHPMYIGLALLLIGSFLLFPTVAGLILLCVVFLLVVKKISLE